ncbi:MULTISPECIES: LysR family transcriptional regulator [Glaesserella]|uniref:LysR family transcriptional regulator n=1 Tax=Glaesserella australis TaxID=2094024 RepID=A0A328BZ16_9PAST|nr:MULTISPECIES: LysR family transcriptional regulator [Glaesserella]AUI66307.1 transcriptional regulator [Glaesserella sp. 15-184]RAL19329.1 LysR family transcriptional regulator [Glaesserella australis]
MYDYRAMSVFVTVVELGSMQAAAEQLAMTPSAVTQSIQKLETGLQIKLLNRTTRKLSLTEAGEIFYQNAKQMQQSAENAVKSVELLRETPFGQLNIACVTGLMDSHLVKVFKSVLDKNPDFHLNLMFEDKVLDLLDGRIDIALRAGPNVLDDNMIARHLYDFEWAIVGHRDYFAEKGMPTDLDALAKLDWISFSNNRFSSLLLNNQNATKEISPAYRISCNSLYASRRLTMNGLGISIQPEVDVQKALASGELIQVFPEWKLPPVSFYLVTLQRVQSEKVRVACELISDYFKQLKG